MTSTPQMADVGTVTVAAVDLGATSGRVVAGRIADGHIDIEVVHRFVNGPVRRPSGLHWDHVALFDGVLAGLRKLAESDTIAAIGIDSWAVDYALLCEGRVLDEPFHYRDERTADGVERVHQQIAFDELYRRNGLQFLPFNSIYQIAAEQPTTLADADRLLLIPDLFAYFLTDVPCCEYTNATTTGLINVETGGWDDELIERLGFDRSLFPELKHPGDLIGHTTASITEQLNADRPIPVIAVASHDTASAVVGAPLGGSGVYASVGTWSLVGLELAAPVVNSESLAANFTNEGGVGGTTRFLRNVAGLWILNESLNHWRREGIDIALSSILDQAARLPEPPVVDADDPRYSPPGDMPARIAAHCRELGLPAPTTPPEFVRMIIESIAAAIARAASDAARIADVDVDVIHIIGGGSLNELLCQRIGQRSGLGYTTGPVEATALGNVMVQATSLGLPLNRPVRVGPV